MPKIIMKFTPGKPDEIRVEGAPGGECRTLSKPFTDFLGGQVIKDTPTAEACQPERQTAQQTNELSVGGQ